ncbi:MAG: chorismate synthase [Bacteroidales bacterium]|nr:chorismate synthase [Bacteroidales bacterium]MCF8333767.1 chorismate synthase [Bacteroidales bacterium]
MAGNTFGEFFRLTTFGESHGIAIGGVLDGCPPGLTIDKDRIQGELNRRKPGQSDLTTPRKESDEVQFLSGIFDDKTTGTPIAFTVANQNQNSSDYSHLQYAYRPSHADFTYEQKYGYRDYRGGGRSSARETIARVVGGTLGRFVLDTCNIDIKAYVSSLGNIELTRSYKELDLSAVEDSAVRCPDPDTAKKMTEHLLQVKSEGDTLGGTITCVIRNVPRGLGEPVFDKLHADLGKAMLNINAVKGFEYGSGFEGTKMKGSAHNDKFYKEQGSIRTLTNHSGGIQGGISNGEDIYFRVAFKPIATVMKNQESVARDGSSTVVEGKGRHDVTVIPRAVPIVEAMASLVLTDHLLRQKIRG